MLYINGYIFKLFIHVIYSSCLFMLYIQAVYSCYIFKLFIHSYGFKGKTKEQNQYQYVSCMWDHDTLDMLIFIKNQYRSHLPDVVVNSTIDQSAMFILCSVQHTSLVAIIPNTLQKNSAALHRTSLCALNLCLDSTTNTTSVCCGFSRVFCHSSMKVDVSTTISGAFSAESYTRN